MEEKRKQEILAHLAHLHASIEHLRKAIGKGNEPAEALALGIVALQVEILKEQYEALQLARLASNGGNRHGTG